MVDFNNSVALNIANGKSVDTNAWDQQNSGKVDWNDPNVPIWTKMGFGNDQAAYEAAYGQQAVQTPTTSTAPFVADQGTTATTPTDNGGYDTSTPFGSYLSNNQGNRDAWASTQELLKQYGLDGLTDWAKNELINGRSSNEITLDMMQQQAFKDRFPVIAQQQKAGQTPWTPAAIISYEQTVGGIMQSAGLTPGFYDDPVTDIQPLIAKGISASEVNDRVINGYSAVMQQPQDVRDQWYNLGYTTGDIVSHFLDPNTTEALLTKQQAATQRAAEAKRSGYGQLSTAEADWMAGAGISSSESQQGFTQLAKEGELFNTLPGEAGSGISRDQQLGAAFQGNAADQNAIEQQAKQRVSQFSGGGGFTQGQDGRTGIGSAQQ